MADGTRFAGRVFDGSGTAVNAATINLYDVGTVTPVRATTTTNSTGDWEIDHATRGLFDIEVVNGTTTRRITQDTEAQFKSMWLWNADADEYALGVTRTEDAASVEVAYFEGDRATPADNDLAYISLRLSDSAGNQDEQARIGWAATTVLNGATQDGDLILSALVNNTLTEFMRLDGSAASINFPSGMVLDFGSGDVTITHSANTLTIAGVATRVDWGAGIFELNNAIEWDTGVAVVAGEYSIGRDADATNQLHLNVPTGATFELSVNDVAEMTLSATAVDFLNNSITTTGALTIASFGGNWTNAGRTVADLGIVTTVDINGGTLDGAVIGGASAAAITGTTIGGTILTMSGTAYIGDTANANATLGLTINQGAADDQILAFKSSDIATGLTTLPTQDIEADDFATFSKQAATDGGLNIQTLSKANLSMVLAPWAQTDNTTKTTGGLAPLFIQVNRHDGANGLGAFAADSNLVIFRYQDSGGANTRFIFDVEGSAHADVEWVAFNAYDDLVLVNDIEQHLLNRETAAGTYNRHALEVAGIIGRDSWHFENGKPRAMVNFTKLAMLHHGALMQIGTRLDDRDERIAALEGQIDELRHRLEAGRN